MRILGSWDKLGLVYGRILSYLVLADIALITISLILQISDDALYFIEVFDFFVCIILLGEYFYGLIKAPSKKNFIFNRDNILGLIASIPFDFIVYLLLPGNFSVSILGYLRLFRFIRIITFAQAGHIGDFFEKTGFHKIIISICIIIVTSTVMLFIFGSSYNLFDYFYFVIQ